MPIDWISTAEAAHESGYHPEYIRKLIREGKIKASRKGFMFWIDHESLREFLAESHRARKSDRRHGPHKR